LKSASLNELKNELVGLKPNDIIALCIRLAKYKKDNKELLTYLLFEANDERGFIDGVKAEIDQQFESINKTNVYFAKKSLRKILRFANKNIKHSGAKQTEVDILIYFCSKLRGSGLPIVTNSVLSNLYQRQVEKIQKSLSSLHEDLQYDYNDEMESLLRLP